MNIPIFLSSDNNYAPFVATTIASICDNTDSFCEFYILDGGISKENQAKICELKKQFSNFSIEFLKLDFEEYFKDFKVTERVTKSMYSRFLIPQLKPEIDKAIYSDVDVIFLDDIKKMYNEDTEDKILGAVWEEYCSDKLDRKSLLNISKGHKYFYSGNLVINCELWRKNKITKKLLELWNKVHDNLLLADMDLLNKYFDCNNYKQLPSKYCYLNEDYEYFGVKNPEIVVRHFAGCIKPWQADFYIDFLTKKPKPIKDADKFWKYAKMTPFYDTILKTKEDFLNSNVLYKRFNKMVTEKV